LSQQLSAFIRDVRPARAPNAARRSLTALLALLCLALPALSVQAEPATQQNGAAGASRNAVAQKAPTAFPLPPRRPPHWPPTVNSPQKTPSPVAPQQSDSGAPKLSPPILLQPVDPSTPPPTLPRASRQAMRRCTLEWEKMKREGHVGAPMWREFATGCLTK